MKILKENQIAGYKTEMRIKTDKGTTLKYFSSVSGIDFDTAERNVFKRMIWYCTCAIGHIENKGYQVDENTKQIIKLEKLTTKHFRRIIDKIKPNATGLIESTSEEIEIN